MKLIEILKVAIAAIWAHKLRSALTLLGMIVGVTAFVTVVSLIQGFNVYIDEKIAGIGAKSFSVQRFNPFEDFKDTDTIAAAQRRNKELTLEDYDFIKERAKARGVSEKEYMRGNLLQREVTADDVAQAFLHQALALKTTADVTTVDGGNIAATLR